MRNFGRDLDGNGSVGASDTTHLINLVTSHVRRMFEPFDVDVQLASAANWNDVTATLGNRNTNDGYIMVAGR